LSSSHNFVNIELPLWYHPGIQILHFGEGVDGSQCRKHVALSWLIGFGGEGKKIRASQFSEGNTTGGQSETACGEKVLVCYPWAVEAEDDERIEGC
jgi:hypothetical protein